MTFPTNRWPLRIRPTAPNTVLLRPWVQCGIFLVALLLFWLLSWRVAYA